MIVGILHFTVRPLVTPGTDVGSNGVVYAISDAVTVGEKEFAATTALWGHPAFVTIELKHLRSDLVLQMCNDSIGFDSSPGQVRVPVADLVERDSPGDGISYPFTTSGLVGGSLVMSHRFIDIRRMIADKGGAEKDEITPAEEIPIPIPNNGGTEVPKKKKKKYGWVRRLGERVAASAAVTFLVGLASCGTPDE